MVIPWRINLGPLKCRIAPGFLRVTSPLSQDINHAQQTDRRFLCIEFFAVMGQMDGRQTVAYPLFARRSQRQEWEENTERSWLIQVY